MTSLIIEDDKLFTRAMSFSLKILNHTVYLAQNGSTVFEKIKNISIKLIL
jgi:DNA-binding response OmpR family regulator